MTALASLPAAVGGAVLVAVAVLLLAFAAIWVVEWGQRHIERGREAKAMADERDAAYRQARAADKRAQR